MPQSSGEVKSLPPASRLPTAQFLTAFHALPALDFPSALWHGANNRPKGHCGPSACKKKHVFAQPEPAFALKSVRTRGLFEFRPTFQRDIEKSRSNQVETANLTDAEGMTLEIVGRSRDILSPRPTFWCFVWTDAQFCWADAQLNAYYNFACRSKHEFFSLLTDILKSDSVFVGQMASQIVF